MNAFKLNVWKKAQLDRSVMYTDPSCGFSEECLLEELFQWKAPVSVGEGCSFDQAELVREHLQLKFSPGTSVNSRSVVELQRVVEILTEIASQGAILWSSSDQQVTVAPVIATQLHLQWILDTFRDVPSATVTVR